LIARGRRAALVALALVAISPLVVGCGDDSALPAGAPSTTATTPTGSTGEPPSTAPAPSSTQGDGTVERLRAEVLDERRIDDPVFTQGLELHDGELFVSGGLYGESSVQVLDPVTGELRRRADLDDSQFGEGLTVVDDRVVVLTWRENTALVLDPASLDEVDRHDYGGEGWGLCDDGGRLVMSDGSATLQFRDRASFAPLGTVAVTLDGQPLEQLNELECVDGDVWANVWHTDMLVRIDPASGRVTATVDASDLVPAEVRDDPEAVLNGIAHDPAGGAFLLTGKEWPALFVVRFVPAG
jgi:glutaminyl-peptide cyclotransferase